MKLLLDTCVLLWWLQGNNRLDTKTIDAINSSNNQVFVSAASIWEIYIKQAIGKLAIDDDLVEILKTLDIKPLDILFEHGKAAAQLPLIHKDPFDRMLIAQATTENMTIVTSDHYIPQYQIKTIKAG